MHAPIFLVDAFTSTPCTGNAAAVTLLSGVPGTSLTDAAMQKLAAEMAQSETAFVEPVLEHAGRQDVFSTASAFNLRWFTPTTEVPMCGHATFAAAAVLYQELQNSSPSLSFHTKSGTLTVRRVASGSGSAALAMEMSMPIALPDDPLPEPLSLGIDSPQAQRLIRACTGELQVAEVVYTGWNNLNYMVMRLADSTTRQQLEAIKPDTAAMLSSASAEHVHGVIVTCRGDAGGPFDFLARFFGPWLGIPEDPVTGSAYMVLGPYWARQLGGKGTSAGAATGMDKSTAGPVEPLRARQCSPRGGEVQVVVQHSIGNVLLTGTAVMVLKGTVLLPPA